MYLSDIYTLSANLAGLAGISLPGGFSSGGLPIGIQLLGPVDGDRPDSFGGFDPDELAHFPSPYS